MKRRANAMPKHATRIVLAWAGFYTRGIPRPIADERRREIASDLYEQSHVLDDDRSTAKRIFVRAVRGVPADIAWREHQLNLTEKRRLSQVPAGSASIAIRLSLMLTAISIVVAISGAVATVRSFANGNPMSTSEMPMLLLASTVIALAGLLLARRPSSQLIGSIVVSVSVVALGAAVIYGMPSLGGSPSDILATVTMSLPRGLWGKAILITPALILASVPLALGIRLTTLRRIWSS